MVVYRIMYYNLVLWNYNSSVSSSFQTYDRNKIVTQLREKRKKLRGAKFSDLSKDIHCVGVRTNNRIHGFLVHSPKLRAIRAHCPPWQDGLEGNIFFWSVILQPFRKKGRIWEAFNLKIVISLNAVGMPESHFCFHLKHRLPCTSCTGEGPCC